MTARDVISSIRGATLIHRKICALMEKNLLSFTQTSRRSILAFVKLSVRPQRPIRQRKLHLFSSSQALFGSNSAILPSQRFLVRYYTNVKKACQCCFMRIGREDKDVSFL